MKTFKQYRKAALKELFGDLSDDARTLLNWGVEDSTLATVTLTLAIIGLMKMLKDKKWT